MRALDRLPRFVSHIWCVVLFFFGWLLFAVTGLSNVGRVARAMFGAYGWLAGTSTRWELQSWSYVSLVPVFYRGVAATGAVAAQEDPGLGRGRPAPRRRRRPGRRGNAAVPPCQVVCEGPGARRPRPRRDRRERARRRGPSGRLRPELHVGGVELVQPVYLLPVVRSFESPTTQKRCTHERSAGGCCSME